MSESSVDAATNSRVRNLVYICPVDHKGTSVFVKGWLTSHSKKPPIILVHDLGENVESYEKTAQQLALEQFNVYSFDMRGQNKAANRLAPIQNFEQLAHDLLQVSAWVKHAEKGEKPIIFGQGLGALIAINFATKYPKYCQGLVLASPLFSLPTKIGSLQRGLLRTLSQISPNLMTPAFLCPKFTYKVRKDQLISFFYPRMPVHFVSEILDAISKVRKLYMRLNLPVFLICSVHDPICKHELLQRIVLKHKNSEKIVFHTLDTIHHQILSENEDIASISVNLILPWLNKLSFLGHQSYDRSEKSRLQQDAGSEAVDS